MERGEPTRHIPSLKHRPALALRQIGSSAGTGANHMIAGILSHARIPVVSSAKVLGIAVMALLISAH